ncbi:hypothetical protein DL764_007069 [Monosporascus ibericus]|uniref:Heterokaryon incompatibility domain-containing protein n=1 Tax=Monosporascus ibericus TaxID=155417 RepID=A0A4Q4T350_9PEZI|nr:hypothetical protein DL764_007069 [Monosporascus ibericus]
MSRQLLIEAPPQSALGGGDNDVLRVEQITDALFKLTLTRQNRSDLLSYGISNLERNREEAELVLRNLGQWVPPGTVAASFSLRTAEGILDTPFRLVCASESGIPFDGGFRIRQYLAVSYCWHSDEWPPEGPAREVAHPWPISGRFAEAVLRERGHPREGVWMDQLCIRQEDEDEKRRAIAAMDIIYKSCRKVLVLLEDVVLTEDEIGICTKYDMYSGLLDVKRGPDEEDMPVFSSFLAKMGQARWWRRSWCLHEFMVVEPWSDKRHHVLHNTTFIIGSAEGTVSVNFITVQRILSQAIHHEPHTRPPPPQLTPYLAGFDNTLSPYRDAPTRKVGSMRASILARYNAVAATGCTMAADQLSVMINLSSLGIAYTGPDISRDEAYFLSVVLALAAGEEQSLTILTPHAVVLQGQPSWVSGPSTPGDVTHPRFTLKSLTGIHGVSMHSLELDLVVFNFPLRQPTEEEVAATYGVFPDLIRSTPPPWKPGQRTDRLLYFPDEELEAHRRRFLAVAMTLDAASLRRLWAAVYRDIIKTRFDTGMFAELKPNKALRQQARDFVSRIPAAPAPSPSSSPYSPAPNHGPGDSDLDLETAALFFLTWVTDQRTFNYLGVLPLRARCTAAGDQALVSNVMVNSHFSLADVGRIQAAIPTALLGSSCLPHRLWLLQPVTPGDRDGEKEQGRTGDGEPGRWRVVGKAMLLGEPDLHAELDSRSGGDDGEETTLTLRKNQVVVG